MVNVRDGLSIVSVLLRGLSVTEDGNQWLEFCVFTLGQWTTFRLVKSPETNSYKITKNTRGVDAGKNLGKCGSCLQICKERLCGRDSVLILYCSREKGRSTRYPSQIKETIFYSYPVIG